MRAVYPFLFFMKKVAYPQMGNKKNLEMASTSESAMRISSQQKQCTLNARYP